MDKDRIAGSAKDFAGKVEGAAGSMAGDAKTRPRASSAKSKDWCRTCTVRPRTPSRTAPWQKRLRTIRSARCWSPAASALRWRC
jgi:hypothetical protein